MGVGSFSEPSHALALAKPETSRNCASIVQRESPWQWTMALYMVTNTYFQQGTELWIWMDLKWNENIKNFAMGSKWSISEVCEICLHTAYILCQLFPWSWFHGKLWNRLLTAQPCKAPEIWWIEIINFTFPMDPEPQNPLDWVYVIEWFCNIVYHRQLSCRLHETQTLTVDRTTDLCRKFRWTPIAE